MKFVMTQAVCHEGMQLLDGTGADRIPVIMNAFSLPVMQYGYTMPEVLMSPEKMTECMADLCSCLHL